VREKAETRSPPGEVVPHVIHPNAVYTVAQLQRALLLRSSTIRREYREGRLRISKRAGRHYVLGEWVLEWIRAGELPNRRMVEPTGQPPTQNSGQE
jgi:hypothetical protein